MEKDRLNNEVDVETGARLEACPWVFCVFEDELELGLTVTLRNELVKV